MGTNMSLFVPIPTDPQTLQTLSDAAKHLLDKMESALGWCLHPVQVRRIARAEADAALVRANADIEITDRKYRAFKRLLEEEDKAQANIESITSQAIPLIQSDATPDQIDNDWITNFFQRTRHTSDADIQRLWAHVLAGEANQPGSFSRRTINLIGDLDKQDADLFGKICNFIWYFDGEPIPLVFDLKHSIYRQLNIHFDTLAHLESLGLIHFDAGNGYGRIQRTEPFEAVFHGRLVNLVRPENGQIFMGFVRLTRVGQQLVSICEKSFVDGFFEYVCDRWREHSLLPR